MFVYTNKEELKKAIEDDPFALEYAHEKLKDDGYIVEYAVRKKGWTLAFASERLRGHKHMAMLAIKQDGRAYQFASKELQQDPELAFEAYKQNHEVIKMIPENLRTHVLEAYDKYFKINEKEKFLVDLKAKKQEQGYLVPLEKEELKDWWLEDEEFVLELLKIDKATLAQVYKNISCLNDRKFILEMAKRKEVNLYFLPKDVLEDQKFCLKLLKTNYRCYYRLNCYRDYKYLKGLDCVDASAVKDVEEERELLVTAINSLYEEAKTAEKDKYSKHLNSIFPHGVYSLDLEDLQERLEKLDENLNRIKSFAYTNKHKATQIDEENEDE